MLEVQVTEIQNPPAVADTAFSSVFDGMFDRMVFELTGTVSVTSVIDKIEELDDRDRISVDYDKDAKECTISVANFGATIKLSSHELVLIARRKCRVSTLLEAFKRLPLVLSEGKLTLLLPEPDEKVE